MKEKVLYVSLPEGAKYQRVEVAEDGKIGIVYIEKECESKTETTQVIPAVPKSKAKSKAKQKDNDKDLSNLHYNKCAGCQFGDVCSSDDPRCL